MDIGIAPQISTVFSLLALIVILVARITITRIKSDKDTLESVSDEKRAEVFLALREKYSLKTEKLSGKDTKEIILININKREQKFRTLSKLLALFLILSALIAIVSIVAGENEPRQASPKDVTEITIDECLTRSVDEKESCTNVEHWGVGNRVNHCRIELVAPSGFFFPKEWPVLLDQKNSNYGEDVSNRLNRSSGSKNGIKLVRRFFGDVSCSPESSKENCFVSVAIAATSVPDECYIHKDDLAKKMGNFN